MNRFFSGYVIALFAVLLWSLNFIVARLTNEQISPISLAFWRWTFATLLITPFFLHKIPNLSRLFIRHWRYLLITALFGVTAFNTLLYIAAQTTVTINLSLIAISYPIFTIILLRLTTKEAIKPRQFIGIAMVVFGVVTLIVRGQYNRLLNLDVVVGDLWMLSAAFLFALYGICVKNKPQEIDASAFLFLTFSSGLLMLLPFFLWHSERSFINEYDLHLLWAILYVAVGPSIICYISWNRAIALIGAANTALIYYTLPIFSAIAAAVFLHERIGAWHIVSSLLIISGIVLASFKKRAKKL